MIATASTGLTPSEACRRIILSLDLLYHQINAHDKSVPLNRLAYEEREFERLEISVDLVRKLEHAFIRSIYQDAIAVQTQAQKDPKTAQQVEHMLEHIEELLKHVQKAQYLDMRKGNFLRRLAGHLRGETKHAGRQLKRFEIKLEKQVRKETLRKKRSDSAKNPSLN